MTKHLIALEVLLFLLIVALGVNCVKDIIIFKKTTDKMTEVVEVMRGFNDMKEMFSIMKLKVAQKIGIPPKTAK